MEVQDFKCEVLIIGTGPAGLSAAVYCGRANRDTIVLEGKEPSSLTKTQEIQNWLGEIDISGLMLFEKFKKHAESYESVKLMNRDVISLMLGMGTNLISTRTANISADVVIIATGSGERKEVIKGENALLGYGVSYSALYDGPSYKDKVVYLYGRDEEVMEDALVLNQMGCIVRVISDVGIEELPQKVYEVKDAGIEVIEKMKVIEAISDSEGKIQKIACKPTESESDDVDRIKEFELSCLFILSHISSNSIYKKAGVVLDDMRNIKVDGDQKTNIKGVYAAGDCTGGLFQVVFAAAEGARAGINACKYLRHQQKK
ncbi:MAG: FAD-dependent oxidoreductase [Candidatus Lokiarchaeota archaeon]|nr:FAD-dependent oxidoreductase [Candidatus Lokiarchaeota archaeon]